MELLTGQKLGYGRLASSSVLNRVGCNLIEQYELEHLGNGSLTSLSVWNGAQEDRCVKEAGGVNGSVLVISMGL